MRINATALQVATVAATLLSVSAARADNSPLGLWIDHTGRGAVEIKQCNGNKLCGHIVWLKDSKNLEACGEQVLGDVKPVGGNKWDNGWIYDPEAESKYDVELTPLGDKLRVVGYAGSKWLSETMTWKRAPADLQKCTKPGAAAAAPAAAVKPSAAAAPVAAQPEKLAKVESPAASDEPAATTPAPAIATKAKAKVETKVEAKADTAPQATTEARTESELKPSANAAEADEDQSGDGATANAQPNDDVVASAQPDDGAGVNAQDDDKADDSTSSKPKKKGEALKQITEALNLKKLKNGKCKMDVPFVDMQVTFDCDE